MSVPYQRVPPAATRASHVAILDPISTARATHRNRWNRNVARRRTTPALEALKRARAKGVPAKARVLLKLALARTQGAGLSPFVRKVRVVLAEKGIPHAIDEDLPPRFDYLESQLGQGPYLVGDRVTIADVAVTSMFANLQHAGVSVDAARWPKLAKYIAGHLERASLAPLIQEEKALLGKA